MNDRRVNRHRIHAGWLCVALGFALVVLLGLGVVDPIGMHTPSSVVTLGARLAGLLPSVGLAAAVFAIGLWLLKGPRGR
jgi:hypothetical protein